MTRLPTRESRTVIVGSTGSGKTTLAIWELGLRWNPRRIGIIFDFKGDPHLARLDATEINIFGPPPKKPGLYIVRPIPELHDEAVEKFMWRCWAQENMLIYIDEGYMIARNNKALNALLTQGRTKRIEMIILSQRPRWLNKFVFSEASFFAIMHLTLGEDRDYVSTYVNKTLINSLPKYHALWYDVEEQEGVIFKPVPPIAVLVETINSQLGRRLKAI